MGCDEFENGQKGNNQVREIEREELKIRCLHVLHKSFYSSEFLSDDKSVLSEGIGNE